MLSRKPVARITVCLVVLLPLFTGACHRKLRPAEMTFPDYESWPAVDEPQQEPLGAGLTPSDAAQLDPSRVITASQVADLAAARHPAVLVAQAQLDEAQAHVLASGAWENPELEGTALFGSGGPEELEAALMFAIPVGGRTVAAHKLAQLERAQAHDTLGAAIKEARIEAQELVARLAHARAELAVWETLAGRSARYAAAARRQEAAGLADPVDISLVLGDAARDQRELVRSRSRCIRLESELRNAAGLASGDGRIDTPENPSFMLREARTELLDAAQEHRDSWRSATQAVRIADQAAALADLERLPDLSLGPAFRTDLTAHNVGVAVGIPIPILQPGTGAYRAALARRDLALSLQRAEAREAVAEIDDLVALLALQQGGLLALEETALPSSEAALEMAEGRYQSASIDVLKLLAVHRAYAGQELERQELLLERQLTLFELQRAVGRPIRIEIRRTEAP